MPDVVLDLRSVTKTYHQGDTSLTVLKNVSLQVHAGEIVALVGASGSGKSTLLHIAGLLDQPTSGEVLIQGTPCWGGSEKARTQQRLTNLGFVYQFHHLLPEFSALENVALPQILQGVSKKQAQAKAHEMLHTLGLSPRADHRPARLSGGEQQRVAILRALVHKPRVLLADEPTGNLDEETAHTVFTELLQLVRSHRIGALIATHDPTLAAKMDRTLVLSHGQLQ
jgi:lipoprotein-releasing system ATP-binding protein